MGRLRSPTRVILTVVILALFVPRPGLAQDRDPQGPRFGYGIGRLAGIVTDDGGNPVSGARVVLRYLEDDRVTFEMKTDQKGEWRILGLGTGRWNVAASADGYATAEIECSVSQLSRNPPLAQVLTRIQTSIQDPTPGNLLDKGGELFYQRKYGEAAAVLLDYLRLDPQDVMARLLAGDCLRENGEFQKSLEQFGIVVEMTAQDPLSQEIRARGLTGLAECYFKLGDLEKAEAYFRSSIEISGDNEVVAYNLGEVYFSFGKIDEAIRFYELAAQLSPAWADPLYRLGYADVKASRYDRAEEAWGKFLALESSSPRAVQLKKDLKAVIK